MMLLWRLCVGISHLLRLGVGTLYLVRWDVGVSYLLKQATIDMVGSAKG